MNNLSDERLENKMEKYTDARKLVENFASFFNKKKAKGLNLTLQMVITEPVAETFHMVIKNETCVLNNGPCERSPDMELKLSTDTLSRVFGGHFSMKKAIKMGLVEKKGRISNLMKIPKIFSGNREALYYKKTFIPWKKPGRVLILNGAPRKKQGAQWFYESILTKPFFDDPEIKTEHVFLKDLKMTSCKGCFYCQIEDPGQCIIKDELSPIMDRYFTYDLVILSSPIYIGYCSSLMKLFLDRTFRYVDWRIKFHDEKYAQPTLTRDDLPETFIFSISGIHSKKIFGPFIESIRKVAHIKFMDSLFIPGAFAYYNSPVKFKRLDEICDNLPIAAREIINNGRIGKKTKKEIEKITFDQIKLVNSASCNLDLERSSPENRLKYKYVPQKKRAQ